MMKAKFSRLAYTLLFGLLLGAGASAQGSLSSQVLQLLTRDNSWTGKNTYLNFRMTCGVPSDTALRMYCDASNNLYFNGVLIAGAGGGVTPHNLLSTTHPDTLAAAVVRGDVIIGNATPAWSRLAVGASGTFLRSNGTDVSWGTDASSLTSIPAANLTGTIAAISGVNLTNLNASNLASGTVALARLSGITNAQIDPAAAIAYSKLSLAGLVNLSSDTAATALPFAKGGTGLTTAADDTTLISSGAAWVATAIPNCTTTTSALGYNTATNAFSCITVAVGTGTVTSAALALPAIFSVAGSPITTSGTFTVTLATETANTVWAGPSSGGAVTPTFRALVNADLPLSGVGAATYAKVTVNTRGVVTAASAQITLTTDVTGTLPMANGGTGVTVAGDDTVLVGSGAAWVAATLPNCTYGLTAYTQATNLFSCPTSLAASAAGVGTLGTTALPYASLVIGTAATNNLSVTPAAFAAGVVATVDDPALAAVKLPLVRRGTIAFTSAAIGAGTCSTAVTATITGLATTAAVGGSLNGAPPATWQTGVFAVFYPTANTLNLTVCNGTAGSITPVNQTFNYWALVP